MKTKTLVVALLMAVGKSIMLSSCATKERAISRLENFSYELRDHSAYYDLEDWKKAGEKFVDIRKEISKHELEYTSEQKARIGQLEGKCAGYMSKGAKEGIFDKIKGFGTELNGIIKGILNAVTE